MFFPDFTILLHCNPHRLRRFIRHDILEGLTESTARPLNCKVPSLFFDRMPDPGLHSSVSIG